MTNQNIELLKELLKKTDEDIADLKMEVRAEFKEIRKELRDLNQFKWKLEGRRLAIAAGVATLISILGLLAK